MEIVTSWMKDGIKQGLQQGLEQGLEKGLVQGRKEEASRLVMRLLNRRFDGLDEAILESVSLLSLDKLEEFAEDLLDFKTAHDVELWLSSQA